MELRRVPYVRLVLARQSGCRARCDDRFLDSQFDIPQRVDHSVMDPVSHRNAYNDPLVEKSASCRAGVMSELLLQSNRQRHGRVFGMRGEDLIRKVFIGLLTLGALSIVLISSCEFASEVGLALPKPQTVGLGPLHSVGSSAVGIAVHWECIHLEVARRTMATSERPGWIHHPRTLFSCGARPLGPWVHYWVRAPSFLVVISLLAYPLFAFVTGPYRRFRRRRNGQCIHCGYDLAGNVSGVCPECGVKV